MINITGAVSAEWIAFVRRLNAHFGRAVVARLVTDSAPYFQGHDLQHFNRTQGIDHTLLPPHTQELNGVCERTLGTVLSMARVAHSKHAPPSGRMVCA